MAIYKYTTVPELRTAGITAAMVSDANAAALIEEASLAVNSLTSNWFVPIRQTAVLDGQGNRALLLPAPQLEIITDPIVYDSDRSTTRTLEASVGYFESTSSGVDPGDMATTVAKAVGGEGEVVSQAGDWFLVQTMRFPDGVGNVSIEGFYGCISPTISKFETTTTVSFDPEDTTITLTDGTGFNAGKIVSILVSDEVVYSAIILSRSTNVITVDKAYDLDEAVAIGATVVTFGKVPYPVKRACLIMCVELSSPLAESIEELGISGRLISERTDSYSYSLQSGDGLAIGGGGTYLSSISLLLSGSSDGRNSFVKPGYVGMV